MTGKIKEYIVNPCLVFNYLGTHGFFKWIPDEKYLEIAYWCKLHKKLDTENPITFNEKIQWLKLNDHNEIYTSMVDKYETKNYASSIIDEKYIIPTFGVWNHFDDIDFDRLPNSFVLKCTHDSGGLVIVKDKYELDRRYAKAKLETCLKRNYFYGGREWPYKNVRPRIIAEKYMVDEFTSPRGQLYDYKVFNFNGEPRIIQVDVDRFSDHKRFLYSVDWEYIDATIRYPTDKHKKIERPKVLNEMLDLARKLSNGIRFLRTDFYCIDNCVFLGELTFYPGSGFERITPEQFDVELGNMLSL